MCTFTERLKIRLMREDDWQDIRQAFVDFELSENYLYDFPLPMDEIKAREQVKRWAELGCFYVVSLKGEDEVLGYLCFPGKEDEKNMGYLFQKKAQGRGIAFEAAQHMIEDVRRKGVRIITAEIALNNAPSIRLIHRLGFSQTGEREFSFREGKEKERCGIFQLIL